VLDIDGFIPAHLNLALLAHAFPALEVLRMRTGRQGGYTPYLPFPAPTLVLFTNSQGEPPSPDEDEPEVVPRGASCRIPPGTTKLVINMKGNDVRIADLFPATLNPPMSLRELVLVLPAYRPGQMRGYVPGVFMDHIVGMDLSELFMAYYDQECMVTVVGADEIGPGYADTLRRQVSILIPKDWSSQGFGAFEFSPESISKAYKINDSLKFVSRAQYIARVGKRVAEVETVEKL
jgi:hypothetical protein